MVSRLWVLGCSVIRLSERGAVAAGLPKDPRGFCSCDLLSQAYLSGSKYP